MIGTLIEGNGQHHILIARRKRNQLIGLFNKL